MYDLAICNAFFQKKEEHIITYRSGTWQSTIDYILVRRQSLRFIKDCKVIPGKTVAIQHRPLIFEMELEKPKKTDTRSREKKIKWYNLKNEEFELKFITQVGETIENNWDGSTYEVVERDVVEITRRELGESGGGKYVEKETWWWDQQVQEAVKAKNEAFKNWRTSGSEVDKEIYKEYRKTVNISVTKAKDLEYEDMYDKLNTREGQTLIYKLANTRKRRAQDITDNILCELDRLLVLRT